MHNSPPYQMNPNLARPKVMKRRGPGAIQIALGVTAALVALLLGLLVLLLIGFETGPIGFLIGLVSATLPVPIYLMLVLWIDRYESEPYWMLASAFFWGALVAVFFAFVINTATGLAVAIMTDDARAGDTFGAVISAPIVEEISKALILFIFYFWKKDEFDGVIDGIVYAAMVGLGFAMTENIQYYGRAMLQGGSGGLTLVFIIRGALAPFSHPMFTSMTGIGLGLARQSNHILIKLFTPLMGLCAAIAMHAIWNGSAYLFGGTGFVLMYLVIMVPAFFIMFVVIALALRREGRLVREHLIADFNGGVLTPEEYNRLGSVFGRMGGSFNALSKAGFRGWRTSRQFNQIASELAFHRSRVARGITSADAHEREQEYREAMHQLLQELRAHHR